MAFLESIFIIFNKWTFRFDFISFFIQLLRLLFNNCSFNILIILLALNEILFEELQGKFQIIPRIKIKLGYYLEAEVPLVPDKAFLMLIRINLQKHIAVWKALGGDYSLQALDLEDYVVAILYVYLVVFIHVVEINDSIKYMFIKINLFF